MSDECLGRLALYTSSTAEPVSRSEVKAWLKIEEEELADDVVLDGLIATAHRRYWEVTRRSPMKQVYNLAFDETPDDLQIPIVPLVSITSIKGFTDTDATDTGGTSMSSSEYYVDTVSEPGRVVPFGGFTFPIATRVANRFIVQFTAGYSSGTTGVPDEMKSVIKRMVATAYEHRGDEMADQERLMDAVAGEDLFALEEWG